jgi:hypothetical protein
MKALQPSCEKHGGGAISPRLPRWRRFPYDIGLPGYRRADLASDSSSDPSEDIRTQSELPFATFRISRHIGIRGSEQKPPVIQDPLARGDMTVALIRHLEVD